MLNFFLNALFYPFLINRIIAWGNIYPNTLQLLYVLQKKVLYVPIIILLKFDGHSSLLLK